MRGDIRSIIIDDEPSAIQRLQIECAALGINVVATSSNPQQTIELLRKHEPNLVFLDVQMPQKSGLEVLLEISDTEMDTIVVMVTAYSDFMLEAFRNAAFDYLLKPVDRNDLQKLISRYISKEL